MEKRGLGRMSNGKSPPAKKSITTKLINRGAHTSGVQNPRNPRSKLYKKYMVTPMVTAATVRRAEGTSAESTKAGLKRTISMPTSTIEKAKLSALSAISRAI